MASGPIGSGGNNVDVLMRFLLDQQAQAQTTKGISDISQGLQGIEGSFPGDELGKDFAAFQSQLKQTDQAVKQVDKSLGKTKDRVKDIKALREAFGQLSGAASRAVAVSQGIFAAGAGAVGGIFAAANNYVKNAEEATRVTRAWAAETEALQRSGSRVGAVFAEQALPTLKQAAQLAERASRFIERNPEIIQAALKTGLVVAALGAVGTAVTRGIKLVADVGYIAATAQQLLAGKLMSEAANKQLLAAKGAIGGTAGTVLGSAGAIAGGVGLAYVVNQAINEAIAGTKLGNSIDSAQKRAAEASDRAYPGINKYAKAVKDSGDEASQASGKIAKKGVSGTTNFGGGLSADVVNAYIQFKEAAIQAEKDYQANRLSIIKDANAAASAANRSYADSVKKIEASFSKTILSITEDAQKVELRAAQDYAIQRQQVIRDSGQEIQRIEEDLQERLRQIAMESDQRIEDLAISRDALGIIQERRRREMAEDEAVRAANVEISRRRQDLAIRLNDMAQEFQLERLRRREDFEQRIKDAEEQRAEELKRAAEQRTEELKQIRDAQAQKMRELDAQYRMEQIRLREAFIAKVRDLDASLLGEQQLRRNYYAQMLVDARNFLDDYRDALNLSGTTSGTISGSSGTIPRYAIGGYSMGGLSVLDRGEFVLTPRATRAAEQVIGGRLTQQNLMMALAGAGRNVNINDSRRFSGEYTNSMRRAVRQDTVDLLDNYLE